MQTLYADLRFGLRLLRNSPGFTLVAVLTLGLGIAAPTTVFSWIDAVLLRPFPGTTDCQNLALIEAIDSSAPNGGTQVSYLDYRDYRERLKLISGLALHQDGVFSIGDASNSQAVWGGLVSANYFAVLGVKPALGRFFVSEEYGDTPGAFPVAVISSRLWHTRFHSDYALIGRTIRVNRHELIVVGVAPQEFRGTMPGLVHDIWIPVTTGVELGSIDASTFTDRGTRNLYAIARLKSGVSVHQARAEVTTLAGNLASTFPNTNRGISATVEPLWRMHNAAPALLLGPLRILMAMALLVLFIVCANVANLLLARLVSRQREFGIRMALGGSRFRLARQLLTEAFLLASGGALAGVPLASWMSNSLPAMVPRVGVPVALGFELNIRLLGFTVLTCAIAALVAGSAPAILVLRSNVNEILKEGGRSGGSGEHSHRLRGLLVISEVALAVVALVGAGLFMRSFHNARTIYPGFEKHNVLLARFHISTTGYSDQDVKRFCARLTDRLRSAPGVTDAAYADYAPLGSSAGPWTDTQVEGYVPLRGEQMGINKTAVAPGYFRLLHIPLLEGRDFRDDDDANAPTVVIVNQAFARQFFNGASPIGRKVQVWGQPHIVIGLVKDSKHFNTAESAVPYFYAPFAQRYVNGEGGLYVFVKTAADPVQAIATVRREVATIDPNAGAFDAFPLSEWTDVTLLPQKVAASLLTVLGIISLLLAAVGLYSVMAYAVSQRTQEIGIRMALGARPGNVLADVLRRALALTIVGLAAGITAALVLARLVASMLIGIGAADPVTFALTALFLTVIALLAGFLPARRATKVDPMVALRYE